MDWMKKLPRSQKLCEIALPGSHDSGAYKLHKCGPLSSDQSPWFGLFKCVVYNWAKTQDLDFRQQLELGVRYFDIRVEVNPNDKVIYFVHGLFAQKVEEELKVINEFLSSHPSEVVILDFNHFVGVFEPQQHDAIGKLIDTCFSDKLIRHPAKLLDVTLQEMQDNKQQVVILYHANIQKENDFLWYGHSYVRSPWPEKAKNEEDLIGFLNDEISKRPQSLLYVSQGILTEDGGVILGNLCSNLKSWSASVRKTVQKWVGGEKRTSKLNIVITDFVDDEFVKAVIKCNSDVTAVDKSTESN